jgi:predicted dehydrogenase
VVYVATPHSHHYQNVKSALLAKKHVLCEKPFTVNSKQADLLVSLAQKQNVFLLEAVWTRFFPLTLSIRDLIRNGEIGHVHRVTADFSTVVNKQEKGLHHRMFNPELAGGSLLDLGVYSLNWLILAIYDAQNQRQGEPSVIGTLVKVPETGVDEAATVVLGWDDAIGIATSSVSIPTAPDEANPALAGPAVKVCGSKATITIPYPGVYQPSEYSIHPHSGGKVVKKTFPIPGKGMFWQADETARCIRDGKKESDILPVSETLLVMRIMDRVREQNGFKYPESIEKV